MPMGCVCSIYGEMIIRDENDKLFCPGCSKKRGEKDGNDRLSKRREEDKGALQ